MPAKILILEDDDLLRDVLVKSLEDEDYLVVPASGSLRALAEAESSHFDLIISDVRMQGMDGLDCLAQIKNIQPEMRSIVITGYASEDAPSRALGIEVNEYLYKPIELEVLCTAVERVLDRKEEEAEYVSFFSGLSQKLKKILGKEPPPDLELLRERVYRNFYVACRSGMLKLDQAQAIWSHIFVLERKRLQNPDFEILDKYDHIVGLLRSSAFDRRRIIPLGNGGPSADAFKYFYKKICEGKISLEKLKTAALTFLLKEKASLSPPLKRFFQEIWGPLTDPETDTVP